MRPPVAAKSELEAAINGYVYFGFNDAVATLRDAAAVENPWADSEELVSIDLDARYAAAIPGDAVVADRFETRLATHPEDFAPVDP